jgi:hypothetical protein
MLFQVPGEDRAEVCGLRAPSIFANEIRLNDSRKPNHSELAVHHIPQFRATCKSWIAIETQSYNGRTGLLGAFIR